MLKRQRASSPSPLAQATAPESLPISSDPASSKQGVKRRRIFAPSLDGPSRGWGGSSVAFGDEEDEDDIIMDGHTLSPNLRESSLESAGAYKLVNSLLHDLHAEQQHRRLMSPAANPDLQSASFSSHGWSSPVQLVRKPSFVMHPLPQDVLTTGVKNRPRCEDDVSVYERYEETNRYLGSVFLGRRRDLSAFVDL
ncbi:hypothetical protein BJY52DRAFT_696303 [Lactarius psammicola]|nr:hypothetical protein BJY52DRAFT_696303 [Lactarius psammicola]